MMTINLGMTGENGKPILTTKWAGDQAPAARTMRGALVEGIVDRMNPSHAPLDTGMCSVG
jgi:hypothetical protein